MNLLQAALGGRGWSILRLCTSPINILPGFIGFFNFYNFCGGGTYYVPPPAKSSKFKNNQLCTMNLLQAALGGRGWSILRLCTSPINILPGFIGFLTFTIFAGGGGDILCPPPAKSSNF